MEKIPEPLDRAFRKRMVEAKLDPQARRRWLKWLRFYIDFCLKYGFAPRERSSLASFLQKLEGKGQSEEQLEEAGRSLDLFYEIVPSFDGPGAAEATQAEGSRSVSPSPRAREWDPVFAQLEEVMALRQLARSTRKTYRGYVNQFRRYVKTKGCSLAEVGEDEAVGYLTELAVVRNVSASTQNQAFNALLFLFRHVLKRPYELKDRVVRAKTRKVVPQIFSREEVDEVIGRMPYPYSLVASLLYGCGLRVSEGLSLRVQNFDFDAMRLTVRRGKGGKDRVLPIPESIRTDLEAHLERVCLLHERDCLMEGWLGVFMPESGAPAAWAKKSTLLPWQFFFPAKTLTWVDEEDGMRRFHIHGDKFGKQLRAAVRRSKITKRVTAHTFRHSFASHLLMANYDIRTVQAMLGHADVRTTMIYTQTVPSRTLREQRSPLDFAVESGG